MNWDRMLEAARCGKAWSVMQVGEALLDDSGDGVLCIRGVCV